MIYWQLFLSFVQVGMFSIGGGYAAMPLIQSQVVEQHAWLTMQEFTDLITIAEMTPGPIAVNSATFVGLRIASLPGAIIATLGCITPALFFVSLLSYLYRKYKNISLLQNILACLRPVVVALILGAGLSILSTVLFNGNNETFSILIFHKCNIARILVVQQILHQLCGLLFRHVLWVAVGALQERRIRMTQQGCRHLFAGAFLQQIGCVEMP